MLLVGNTIYERYIPKNEDEFEKIIGEQHKYIFGDKTLYIEKKLLLKSNAIAGIPDAFVITLEPDIFYIVEIELSDHPIYDHIVPQLGKFIAAYANQDTKARLRDLICNEIYGSQDYRTLLASKGEIYRYISELLEKQPRLESFYCV